ncbi:helix-turn-helix domain-containing protein [uncultured Bacteroides sp.]|uniref:AlbA family DNA-binding domain-containing protein n=1 Tax=uncultured Bacteroides sp. TaxID=162156 RepID=UPI00260A4373|nr:ATP-binding protein [uncultured Bacteroides sp.]
MKPTTDSTDYIQKLVAEGEHVHQDFKFAISDARKIARSISAFANTEGGRLLVGVKDNGKIAGVRSEEEIYMIEAAATMYCKPPVQVENIIYKVEGKDVLEIRITESTHKPVCAIDEDGKAWAYVRIADENILATPVHLGMWKHNNKEEKIVVAYTEKEKLLLDILNQRGMLTLNQCVKHTRMPRRLVTALLADFIRFDLVEQIFKEHTFYFKLKED